MREFKVGDRVSVWLDDDRTAKYRGVVKRLMPFGNLQIDLCGDTRTPVFFPIVHPKQCRRLVRKPRMQVYIGAMGYADLVKRSQADPGRIYSAAFWTGLCGTDVVEFREVRKRKEKP